MAGVICRPNDKNDWPGLEINSVTGNLPQTFRLNIKIHEIHYI